MKIIPSRVAYMKIQVLGNTIQVPVALPADDPIFSAPTKVEE